MTVVYTNENNEKKELKLDVTLLRRESSLFWITIMDAHYYLHTLSEDTLPPLSVFFNFECDELNYFLQLVHSSLENRYCKEKIKKATLSITEEERKKMNMEGVIGTNFRIKGNPEDDKVREEL